MKATAKQYAKTLFEIVNELKTDKERKDVVKKFVQTLRDNNQTAQIDKIIKDFEFIWEAHYGITEAEVISASELDKESLKSIEKYIKTRVDSKELAIKNTIDKNVKGGFIIKIGDYILDSSLKTRLNEFKKMF